MYSNKTNVNILTAVLRQQAMGGYVLCPGSRNAPLVNNFNLIFPSCHAVVDERSAAFMALGIAEASGLPAVVCVTSGSALANTVPAVVEGYYRGLPLIVVSADRPQQWIGQHDGQTMRQDGFFGFYAKTYNLPEVEASQEERQWYCSRLVNEAIGEARLHSRPVHINVPISEPLYEFVVEELPQVPVVRRYQPSLYDSQALEDIAQALGNAMRPMVVVGQLPVGADTSWIARLANQMPVLKEPLADEGAYPTDDVLAHIPLDKRETFLPDVVLYVGGELVSKQLKQFLRQSSALQVYRIDPWGDNLQDTFMHLCAEYRGEASLLIASLPPIRFRHQAAVDAYRAWWLRSAEQVRMAASEFQPVYSSFMAVERFVQAREADCRIVYANSMPVRLACVHDPRHVSCNRGVNGIEGSLSTAAGIALASGRKTYCVVGDLSFLYDHNFLQSRQLDGKLRILVLNNGGGAIFGKFEGLRGSDARPMVMGCHGYSVEGICQTFDAYYLSAHNEEELDKGLQLFCRMEVSRPMVLEVFTDIDQDNRVFTAYRQAVGKQLERNI